MLLIELAGSSSNVWRWPLVSWLLSLLGSSLVQANVTHCTCLALGSLYEALHWAKPRVFWWAQMLGLPLLWHHECSYSELLFLPSQNCAQVSGTWSGLNRLLGLVFVTCRRGSGLFLSFSGLHWLNSLWSVGLLLHNAAAGPSTHLFPGQKLAQETQSQ